MKVLLVGGAGFVGTHLRKALTERGHEVFVADRCKNSQEDKFYWNIDLEDRSSIETVLHEISPECIFHLAAQSSVSQSWKTPESTLKNNLFGTLNLFQATTALRSPCRFIFIGSGEEYGVDCSEENPFTETSPCAPRNPYAVSKLAAGQILGLLAAKAKIPMVHLRPFNHYGPNQREGFVIADFCAQIARAEQGIGSRILSVGNLAAKRDFLYIEDVISAYCRIAEAPEYPNQIYNISTGHIHSIQEILDTLRSISTISVEVQIDERKFRPVEVPVLVASSARIFKDFGWKANYSLRSGLEKTLNWWRKKVCEMSAAGQERTSPLEKNGGQNNV